MGKRAFCKDVRFFVVRVLHPCRGRKAGSGILTCEGIASVSGKKGRFRNIDVLVVRGSHHCIECGKVSRWGSG